MKKILIVVMLGFSYPLQSNAQPFIEQQQLVDLPTAGTLQRGSFEIGLRIFDNGGLLGNVAVGITPKFMFGLSYGGANIIGEGDINWNPEPGIQARFRVLDENFVMPAVTVGFNSQGYGAFVDSLNRYVNKSRGFYAVASKNYAVFYNLGFHGGINYSLENDDHDAELNLFAGADLNLNREVRFVLEYDLATNDNENDAQFGSGQGYLNAGFQWIFTNLYLQFNLKNLFKNGSASLSREIKIGYFETF